MKRNLKFGHLKTLLGALSSKLLFIFFFFIPLIHAPLKGLGQQKKIIEFGWDYPTVDFLYRNLPAMEQRPFHGVVFSFQTDILEIFRSTLLPDSYFGFSRLSKIPFRKFTHNFLFIRLQSPDGAQWFDDQRWQIIEANTEKLSKAVKESAAKGCLLDPEYYGDDPLNDPWTFSAGQYPGKSFEQVKVQVRNRGKQFMQALQRYQPKQELLCLWIAGLVIADRQNMPLEKTRQALLPYFFEGMWLAMGDGIKIIDGNELSYWYRTPGEFLSDTKNLLDESKLLLTNAMKAQKPFAPKIAQAVFYDGMYATHPSFDKHFSASEKSNWHQQNLRYALATSDKYLWYYTERMDCWDGKSLSADAMIHLNDLYNDLANVRPKAGVPMYGITYGNNPPMQTQKVAFKAYWNSTYKNIRIEFPDVSDATLRFYTNYLIAGETKVQKKKYISIQDSFPLQATLMLEVEFSSGEKAYTVLRWQ